MSLKQKCWTAVLGWITLIFALMVEGRPLINFAKVHAQFPLLIFMVYGILAAGFVLFLFYELALRKLSTYLFLFAAFLVYTWVLSQVKELEEIAHFVEYGVLSCLIFFALSFDVKGKWVWLAAFGLTAAIGTIEEILQLWVPTRIFDPHDIVKNILAAFFGLLFTAIVQREKRMDDESPDDAE